MTLGVQEVVEFFRNRGRREVGAWFAWQREDSAKGTKGTGGVKADEICEQGGGFGQEKV